MIPVGESYRPTGLFEPVGTIIAAAAALVLAAAVAMIIWIWDISPIPQFLVVTSILQGIAVGYGAYILFRKVRLRNPFIAGFIAFSCGAFSVFLVHYGLYLYFIYQLRSSVHQRLVSQSNVDPAKLAEIDRNTASLADRLIIYPKTEHYGFIGFMLLRNQEGEKMGHIGSESTVSGSFLWTIWALEAVAVAGFAGMMGRSAASEPFCEDCQQWFKKPRTTFWLPASQIQPLTDAVKSGDPKQLEPLKQRPTDFDPGRGSAQAALHECAGCSQTLADVVLRSPSGKKGQFKQRKTIKYLSISKEMIAALQPKAPLSPAIKA